jgi:cytochrome c oxidase subunit I
LATIEHAPERSPAGIDGGLGRPEIVMRGIKPRPTGWLSWITTVDHKRIGIMYLTAALIFFCMGGMEALLIRTQLAQPENTFVTPHVYDGLVTMHGTTMIFLFAIPIISAFANYLIPLMVGARDMAFPRLNALSFWLFLAGGIVLYTSIFFEPPTAGWTMYAPLSDNAFLNNNGADAWILMVHLTGLSSLLGAVNLIATIHNMRAPGMSWRRMPLFVWAILVFAYLLVIALPSIAAAATMLLCDRHFGTSFFEPSGGGDPLLWQHLFWFFGHPEVYVLILPSFGIISEIIPVFARKPIFGYTAIATSTVAIAFLGSLVWAHHMFATPTNTPVMGFFMLSSYAIAVPTGIKIFNWIATLWGGSLRFTTAMCFSVALPAVFVFGGITGILLAMFPVDWYLTDTYFVVAHFHYTLFGGAVFGYFAGLYYWFPKMTGRMMNEKIGKVSFWMILIGFNVTFLVQHALGLDGMVRRIDRYPANAGWTSWNVISTIGSYILAIGVLLTIINVIHSAKRGKKAGNDPWAANTLEWFTTSPPPENNFDVIPRVRSVNPMQDIRREVAAAQGRQVGSVAQPLV